MNHHLPSLQQAFSAAYPGAPAPVFCRAPGRVNIIGEHTDYNGLPVLPMTLAQDMLLAVAPRTDSLVRVANTSAAYPPAEFRNKWPLGPSPAGAWDNYCKAAIDGLNQHFRLTAYPGMDIMATGSIPVSAGLSSSSALVVATALAYLHILGKTLDKDITRIDLATVLAEAEHFVGTRGGGMDQAIILLGAEGQASKIDFFPLRVENVPLPKNHALVVCNSLVKAEKTGDAQHRYNAGPRLCRLITAIVEKQAQEDFGEEVEIESLGELWLGHLCLTHGEVAALIDTAIPRERVTLREAARKLAISTDEVRKRWLGDLPEPEGGFPLKARARHQMSEYRRVEDARDALLAGDAATLGELMNASHQSCARDYEVSCPELEALVAAARKAGALGARLTGAGFGGCTVNLLPQAAVPGFIKRIQQDYYERHLRQQPPDNALFVAQASPAAGYITG